MKISQKIVAFLAFSAFANATLPGIGPLIYTTLPATTGKSLKLEFVRKVNYSLDSLHMVLHLKIGNDSKLVYFFLMYILLTDDIQ